MRERGDAFPSSRRTRPPRRAGPALAFYTLTDLDGRRTTMPTCAPKYVLLSLLVAISAMAPVATAQQPMEVAFADPQPHFVAAWAPKKEREAERAAVLARRASLDLAGVSVDAALKALTSQAGLQI